MEKKDKLYSRRHHQVWLTENVLGMYTYLTSFFGIYMLVIHRQDNLVYRCHKTVMLYTMYTGLSENV